MSISGGTRICDQSRRRMVSTPSTRKPWPTWTPPKEMIARDPKLAKWENGQPGGATCKTHIDHRIAMSFAVAGLLASGVTRIEGAEAAAVSLPEFYSLLGSMGASIEAALPDGSLPNGMEGVAG